jgi:hypothetical protein
MAFGRAFIFLGPYVLGDLELHQLLRHDAHAFAQEVHVFVQFSLA